MKHIAVGIVLVVMACKTSSILGVAGIPPVQAASFYPACLKKDGDWLHGVTRKECIGKDVRGHWYTNRVLKKAQRVM